MVLSAKAWKKLVNFSVPKTTPLPFFQLNVPPKPPKHYGGKLKAPLLEVKKHKTTRQIGSWWADDLTYGITKLNLLFFVPQKNTKKIELDAGLLKTNFCWTINCFLAHWTIKARNCPADVAKQICL